ncbi:MAG: hypothetical protein AAB285_04225, partial [candidate division NC10 bacterium]
TTDPLGHATTLRSDAAGNVVAATDATLRTTAFAYDAKNRLTAVTDAAGGTTRYAYAEASNLTRVTDATGRPTTFTYDPLGQLTRVTNPAHETRQFAYDLARHLARVEDATGQRLEFTYDAAGQLTQKRSTDGLGAVQETVGFSYFPSGDLQRVSDRDSTLGFRYDFEGRLTQATTGDVATPALPQPVTTLTSRYTLLGDRQTLADSASGRTLCFRHDEFRGVLNAITEDPTCAGHLVILGHDALRRRTGQSLASASFVEPFVVSSQWTYDAASQLTSLNHTHAGLSLARSTYTYDPVGNRTTLTDLTGLHAFTYDRLNRLTSADHPLASGLVDEA